MSFAHISLRDLPQISHFKPPGPVAAAFIADDKSRVRSLLGPVGGGKSVACVWDGINRAARTTPCNDGIIRYRRAIIGSTYGQMERNLYNTWHRWLPRDGSSWVKGEWKGGGGRFAEHRLSWNVLHGNQVRLVQAEFIFAALGDQAVELFARGFETTDFWLFEVDQLPKNTIPVMITRLGRYPATGDAPDAVPKKFDANGDEMSAFHRCIVGDLNAPDNDSWFYEMFEENVPPGHRLYKQPSGLSVQAENRRNLPFGYYEDMVETLSRQRNGKNLVKRMVHAQYAPSLDGDPVYPEWNDDIHFSRDPLKPLPNVGLLVGLDQGLRRPAAVWGQRASIGQLRVLSEVMPGRMSARRFAEHLRRDIAEVAPGLPIIGAWADPAGFDGADREDGETAWAETVAAELGVPINPAPSNEIDLRISAVTEDLVEMIDGQTPALLVSSRCKGLRRGFVGNYRYRKQRIGNTDRFADKPDKAMDEANLHDALQYLELGEKGRYGVVAGSKAARATGGLAGEGNVVVGSNFFGD